MIAGRPAALTGEARLFTRDFATLSLAVLVFFVAGGILLPTTPLYTQEVLLGDRIAVGIVSGAFAVASLLMRPFSGWLSDKRGRRIALLLGATISVAAAVGHLAAGSLEILIVMRFALGIGEALFFVAGIAAATDLAPAHRRGEAISLVSLSLYLGIAIGPIIGELILHSSGYAAVWIVTAALYVVSVGLSWIVPETLQVAEEPVAGEPPRKHRLIHPRGIAPGLLALCGVWGMGPFFTFIPLLVDDLGLGSAGPLFGVFAIVVVVLRLFGARLPDRIGAARLSGTAFIATSIGLAISGLAVARVVPVTEGLYAGTILFGAGVAFTLPAILAMAVVGIRPDERGAVVGTAGLFVDAAFGLSPAVLGFVATVTDYPTTFLLSAAIAAIGAAYLLIRRPGAVPKAPAASIA
ncbi:MAG: MFS transporter [Candidatus Limnocylindrales bacterium]